MVRKEFTRRRVLRTGGQAAAAGAVASTAGCLSSIPFVGGGVSPSNWVGAPGAFSDRDHMNYSFVKPKGILNNEDNLPDRMAENFGEEGTQGEMTGISPEDVSAQVSYSAVSVAKASYNKGDVKDELEDNGLEEESSMGGFDIHVAADDSDYRGRAVGVTGGKLVFGQRVGDMDAEEAVETAIDVGNGNEDRYAQEHDGMKKLMNVLGTKHLAFGSTQEAPDETDEESGVFEGNVASGIAWNINGEKSTIKQAYVFEDKETADKEAVREYADELENQDDSTWADADSVNVNQPGLLGSKAVVIKAKIDTDEFSLF